MCSKRGSKRVISITLILCILATIVTIFTACDKDDESSSGNDKTNPSAGDSVEICLPYSREDTLNPFLAKSLINNAIMPLLYSGLCSVDESFAAVPDLASDVEVVNNTLVVTIGSKRFSDGTTISADDVVYSFNKAKESTYYASSLVYFTSVAAANSKTVVFTMTAKNVYAASCLTFPIVKRGSADGAKSVPVGAGRYVYSSTAEGGLLKRNDKYTSDSYTTEQITLVNVPSSEGLMHGLVINNYNAVFDDLSSGTSQRINASIQHVDLNNLVYLGLNTNGVFSDLELRRYLSALIDREELVNSGLEGYGVVSDLPFNPNWYEVDGVSKPKNNDEEAKTYLKKSLAGRRLTILVNSDNNFKVKFAETLADQLSKLGVKASVTSVQYEVFVNGVSAGNYDIYVGEYKLTNDMNISGLISDDLFMASYAQMLAGDMTCADFANLFYDTQPFVPVAFRTGVLAYSRSISTEVIPFPQNPYANIHNWFI